MALAPCTTAGCSNTCTGKCASDCTGECKGNCGSSCGWRACNSSCDSSCQRAAAWESGSCSCGRNCSNECSSCHRTCSGTCSGSASGTSTSSCSACGNSCENNCASNCKGGCKTGCTGTCEGTCSGKCTGSCQTECNYGCISTSDMASYRSLKLTEYINSSNVLTIYKFIRKELERLGKNSPAKYENGKDIFEQHFKKENWANAEAFNSLIEAMNTVTINQTNDPSQTQETDLFSSEDKIPSVQSGENFIANEIGQQIIQNAKTLFNVKIAVD